MAEKEAKDPIQVSRKVPQVVVHEFIGTQRLLDRYQTKHKVERARDGVFSIQFSSNGSMVVIGYEDGAIQMVNTSNASLVKELRIGRQTALAVTMVRFHPKKTDELWGSAADGKLYVCNIKNETCEAVVTEEKNEINCLSFNRGGDLLATGGKDHCIRLYDTATMKLTKMYDGHQRDKLHEEFNGHSNKIFVIKYNPDEKNIFLSGGWDNIVGIWDDRTAKGMQRHITGPHISGDGLDIKDKTVLTASWVFADALQLWDLGSGELIQTLPFQDNGKGAYLYSCRFRGRKQVIAGGSGTNSIQVIRLKKAKVLAETDFKRAVFAIDVDATGYQVAVGGAGRKVLLTKIS